MALALLNAITKNYPYGDQNLTVLKGVNLEINRGDYIALTGVSGSGKTTLMNIIGCLDRPTSGSYALDGHETQRLDNDEVADLRNQKIGFIFQSFQLLPRTSALENVALPFLYSQPAVEDSEAKEKATAALVKLGLGDRLDHTPTQLSGGQQQRVAIARAIVRRPPILLADEPTGNLDSATTVEVLKILEELVDEGMTLVLVTHDRDVASRAKKIVVMKDGQIV